MPIRSGTVPAWPEPQSGSSRSAMTAARKRAASPPVTTRWSKVRDSGKTRRTTISSPTATGQAAAQIGSFAIGDIAQHRHEQAVLGVDRNAEIDLAVQPAALALRIVPDVQRRLASAAGDDGAHQPHGDVTAAPGTDVGVVAHGSRYDLGMSIRHARGHGPADAA